MSVRFVLASANGVPTDAAAAYPTSESKSDVKSSQDSIASSGASTYSSSTNSDSSSMQAPEKRKGLLSMFKKSEPQKQNSQITSVPAAQFQEPKQELGGDFEPAWNMRVGRL